MAEQAERVAIFIDGSNLFHSVKDLHTLYDNEVDFSKLVEKLRNGRLLIGTYYYNAPLDRSYNKEIYRRQQIFFSELKKIPGFHVILCRMRKIRDPHGKIIYSVKGDDISLATDMISLAYENIYDTAILVSGDGDFVPAIKKAQKLGKKVENAYFSVSHSDFLRQVCDKSILLDKVIAECLKSKN